MFQGNEDEIQTNFLARVKIWPSVSFLFLPAGTAGLPSLPALGSIPALTTLQRLAFSGGLDPAKKYHHEVVLLCFLSLVLNPWDSFSLPCEGLRTMAVKMALCVMKQIPKFTCEPGVCSGLAEFHRRCSVRGVEYCGSIDQIAKASELPSDGSSCWWRSSARPGSPALPGLGLFTEQALRTYSHHLFLLCKGITEVILVLHFCC